MCSKTNSEMHIFIYCPHGVCYGFQELNICKSPSHSVSDLYIKIFSSTSKHYLWQCCKLHVCCLNREPALYKETWCYVDWFDWRGHVGCSKGYCRDMDNSMNIKALNSQVNEPANAGFQQIWGIIYFYCCTITGNITDAHGVTIMLKIA